MIIIAAIGARSNIPRTKKRLSGLTTGSVTVKRQLRSLLRYPTPKNGNRNRRKIAATYSSPVSFINSPIIARDTERKYTRPCGAAPAGAPPAGGHALPTALAAYPAPRRACWRNLRSWLPLRRRRRASPRALPRGAPGGGRLTPGPGRPGSGAWRAVPPSRAPPDRGAAAALSAASGEPDDVYETPHYDTHNNAPAPACPRWVAPRASLQKLYG